jgi:DNA repair protein REV1
VTHIIASNLTPKKRVEFERYKVVRPDWIVDCVKAGKTLPWNNYRLIVQGSQRMLGTSQVPVVDGYKSVSSREERVVLGGGGLMVGSQESSSYPTPPEMKSLELEDRDVKGDSTEQMEVDTDRQPDSAVIPVSSLKAEDPLDEHLDIPSTLSSIQISSPPAPKKPSAPIETYGPQSKEPQHVDIHGYAFDLKPLTKEDMASISAAHNVAILAKASLRPQNVVDPAFLEIETDDPPFIDPQNPESPSKEVDEQSPDFKPLSKEDIASISAAHNATILANPSLRPHTVVDPAFLKSYFDQSRLHHLSTWKADLKAQMQQLLGPPRRHSGTDRWILHVDFDCFFCSVSLLTRPELRDKPVCVGHGGAGSGEIASCNYPARKFGIRNGMLY